MKNTAIIIGFTILICSIFVTGFYTGRHHYFKKEFFFDLSGLEFKYISDSECQSRIAKEWARNLVNEIENLEQIKFEYFKLGMETCECVDGL